MLGRRPDIKQRLQGWCYDLWYVGHRGVMRSYFAVRSRVRVDGTEHVPTSGPFIVVSNHVSKFDPTFLMNAIHRKIHFMAKIEHWNAFWSRFYMSAMRCIPVRRGGADRQAILQALAHLSQGSALGVFVEGGRVKGDTLYHIEPGAAMLSIRSGAPILPVVLLVSGRDVTVRIGELLRFEAGPEKKSKAAQYDDFSEQIAVVFVALSGGRLQYTPHIRAQDVEDRHVPVEIGGRVQKV